MLSLRETAASLVRLIRWSLLGGVVGVVVGIGSALFLFGLYWATATRESTPWLLWLLPLGGLAIGWMYDRFGRDVERGTKLLLDRIHGAGPPVPWTMAPMITLATIGTHLFGGSAGREGTAVQMGGSLADLIARLTRLSDEDRRLLLISGISGGFGAVFGTPLAGTVFGLEVLAAGRVRYEALVPCLVASTVGDLVCRACGIEHHVYPAAAMPTESARWLLWVALAGVAFGLASLVFVELTDTIQKRVANRVVTPWLRPFFGGLAIVALTYLVGSRDYLGLSLPLIDRAFTAGGLFLGAFALKILFTAVTLGTGFKGGEVTPLFCIGATLGHSFAILTGQPTAVFAALGFVAVFAGAAKTPLACALMGIELFGAELAIPLMIACVVSYLVAGPRGIYSSE
jgi:H+/Cl- antiporter ClcA